MLAEVYPRYHARYRSLPVLGSQLEGFIHWLRAEGYPPLSIRVRVRGAKRLDAMLRQRGVRGPGDLTAAEFLAYAPKEAGDDVHLSAVVRSFVRYFDEQGVLAAPPVTRAEALVVGYQGFLEKVRGLSVETVKNHSATVSEFLAFVGYDDNSGCLAELDHRDIARFLQRLAERHCRASLQHDVARLRSFLRFLAAHEVIEPGLDAQVDTARVYRGEQLPRALPWQSVRALVRCIDRSTPMGRRDYAMLLLVTTYGLRSGEVVGLRLEDVQWRANRLRIRRPKVHTPLVLPLTSEVGTALLEYLRNGRPELPYREVFLRVRTPIAPLKRTALTQALRSWLRRSDLQIPFTGAHCLRHSLAIHLLRQGTSLKAIGDLLGHRSAESTCVYLRLHIEDLRAVALPLPAEARQEARR